ncbi:uncharacterized protein [Dermacentor andersoni]|uniref:uncharacterized protein n=1 Tax=Dermacentor andersoni TaxID=34620 RepID=UPI0024159A82|nr:uncharacterized protein LOC129387014 [Dermacentor andersoni]
MASRSDSSESRKKKGGTVYCCVYGCHNSYRNVGGKVPNIKFYSFPWKPYEKERRERWWRRASADDGLWQPVKGQTRICSAHFVGNEKGTVVHHPAYIPTIFPSCYGREDGVGPATKLERYKRLRRRVTACAARTSTGSDSETGASSLGGLVLGAVEDQLEAADKSVTFASVGTQTDADVHGGQCCILLSVTSNGSASTQVSHASTSNIRVQTVPTTRSASTATDERSCVFLGYDSLKERADGFRELCGISTNVFALLMSILSPIAVRRNDVPIPQKLVIFLMKLKLGISFASLGVLFGLHLLAAMKEWIPERSFSTVQATMPACFKLHYPRCRYIIDCTEVRTEEPPTVEQRRALFSHYKGGYTLKFLLGILPNGVVTFVSEAYGGRTSDSHNT